VWTTEESVFDPWQGQKILFLFSTASRLAVECTQLPIQWVPGVKWPGVKLDRSSPSSVNAWCYSYTPLYVFMTWCLIKDQDIFTFFIKLISLILYNAIVNVKSPVPDLMFASQNKLSYEYDTFVLTYLDGNNICTYPNYKIDETKDQWFIWWMFWTSRYVIILHCVMWYTAADKTKMFSQLHFILIWPYNFEVLLGILWYSRLK
jgi:hypothetical protein